MCPFNFHSVNKFKRYVPDDISTGITLGFGPAKIPRVLLPCPAAHIIRLKYIINIVTYMYVYTNSTKFCQISFKPIRFYINSPKN